jgi:hypothetical protein
MLTKLLPDQISKWWEIIWPTIEASLPPTAGSDIAISRNILSSLLSDNMQCWVDYVRDENKVMIKGIGTTTFVYDLCTNAKFLLIYTAYAVEKTSSEEWIEGYNTIVNFAKKSNCERIVAYTQNPKIVKNGQSAGAELWTYLSFPV